MQKYFNTNLLWGFSKFFFFFQFQKLALKYIRELRYKSRPNEAVTLVCKICRDKTFTATATLLYHYRSHAGTGKPLWKAHLLEWS